MIISHKYKFITVDIPKTGTRSLRETLWKENKVADVVGMPYDGNKNPLKQHASILDIEAGFKENEWTGFSDYYKYSVVRNPWDRFFSFFKYYKMLADDHTPYKEYRSSIAFTQGEWAFNFFRERSISKVMETLINNNLAQSTFLLDRDGVCRFDRITRFENILQGFKGFCHDVEIGPFELNHANKTPTSLYKDDILTQSHIDMIAEKEEWVIDEFGYNYI